MCAAKLHRRVRGKGYEYPDPFRNLVTTGPAVVRVRAKDPQNPLKNVLYFQHCMVDKGEYYKFVKGRESETNSV